MKRGKRLRGKGSSVVVRVVRAPERPVLSKPVPLVAPGPAPEVPQHSRPARVQRCRICGDIAIPGSYVCYSCDRWFGGEEYAMIVRDLRHAECCFDGLVQLLDFVGVACTHQPLQSLARNREDVVQVPHTATRQSLLTTEHHFGRELTDGSCDECDDNCADGGGTVSRVRITTGRLPTGGGNSAHQISPRFTRRQLSSQRQPGVRRAAQPALRLLGLHPGP